MDLNELSAEEIVGLAYGLVDEMDKTASEEDEYDEDEGDLDLNELSADELIDLAYHLQNGDDDDDDDFEKEAGVFDINELSVDEFIGFASDLEDEMEMEKEAASAKGIKEWLARQGKEAGRRFRHPKQVYSQAQKRMKGKKGGRMSGGGRTSRYARGAAAGAEAGAPYAGVAGAGAGAYGLSRHRKKGRGRR